MIPKVFTDFVAKLLDGTEGNHISWKQTGDLAYVCSQNDVKVFFARHWDDDRSEAWFSFRVQTPEGAEVPFFVYEADGEDFRVMDRMFQAVIANSADVSASLTRFFRL